jgi:hypothetical protein
MIVLGYRKNFFDFQSAEGGDAHWFVRWHAQRAALKFHLESFKLLTWVGGTIDMEEGAKVLMFLVGVEEYMEVSRIFIPRYILELIRDGSGVDCFIRKLEVNFLG